MQQNNKILSNNINSNQTHVKSLLFHENQYLKTFTRHHDPKSNYE